MAHGDRTTARDPFGAAAAAATQNTLNYALGNLGGRQKAWMSATHALSPYQNPTPSPMKRRPGRPPKPQPAEPLHTAQHATFVLDTHRQSPTTSTLTSPQLANVVSHQASSQPVTSPPTAPPFPSPSEEATINGPHVPVNLISCALPPAESFQEMVPVRNTSTIPRNMSPDTIFMEEVRRAALAQKRPAEAQFAEAGKRSRMDGAAHETRPELSILRADNPRRASIGHAQNFPSLSRPQAQNQSPHPRNSSIPQGMHNQHRGHMEATNTPPQSQTPFGPPRSLSRELAQQSCTNPPSNVPSPTLQTPAQASPTVALDEYTQQDCDRMFHQFSATHPNSTSHPLDGKRLSVLKQAVAQRDWAYLTMHQYYCLQTASRDALPRIIKNSANLSSAVQLMQDVLDANDSLSSDVLQFFATFPMPLNQLAEKFPRMYNKELSLFLNFMSHSDNIGALRTSCEQRNYPPLMWELVYDLGITSTIFQRIVFTASLRRLWSRWPVPNHPLKGKYETECINVFYLNQSDFYSRQASQLLNQPHNFESERRERDAEAQEFGTQLKQLCDTYQCALQQSVQTPFLPSQQLLGTGLQPRQLPRHLPMQNQHLRVPASQAPAHLVPPHLAPTTIQEGHLRERPRLYPTQSHPQPHAPSQQTMRSHPASSLATPLLPRPGLMQPQQRQPNPPRFGLHQASLRSPILRAQSRHSTLYQYVRGFLKPPMRLDNSGYGIEQWTFSMTSKDIESIPKGFPGTAGSPPTWDVDENSQMVRLRCIKWASSELPNEHIWATTDTSWIPYTYFSLNGMDLQQRKKLHYGKDLPIDMSTLVKGGINTLDIAIMRQRNDENYRNYLLAIEILGIRSHTTIMKHCQETNYISASTTQDHIKQRLLGATEDDEIAIIESNLTINLFDPFSASRICDVPARSKACLHYDCFDLETFLQTRKRKGDASLADQWKCPICNGDARPQHLIIDRFLEDVRNKLQQQHLLQTRAIIVDQDGSWRPKPEVREGVQDPETPNDDLIPSDMQCRSSVHPEVIDLSD